MGQGKPSKSAITLTPPIMPTPKQRAVLEPPNCWPLYTAGEPKILIVGAGVAGLSCATRLVEAGFTNILVLEAENRCGGRILTQKFGANVIDMGAQWCHGEEGNVVYQMSQPHGLLDSTGDVYENAECVRSNGEVVATDVVDTLKDIMASVFTDRRQVFQKLQGNVSFAAYLSESFFRQLCVPEYEHIDMDVAEEFFENCKKVESSESSSPLEEMSARGLSEYWECGGNYLLNWRDQGYVAFLHLLLRQQKGGSGMGCLEGRVMCGAPVTQICWKRPDGMVEVKYDAGNANNNPCVIAANHVVVTVSLGVLKYTHKTLFEPALPLWKQRSIVGLGFGHVCKIFLEFREAFWPANWTGFTTLWRHEDAREVRDTPQAWLEDIFGFYRVSYQPRVLLAWLVGPHVMTVEQLPVDVVRDGCVDLLKRFLIRWLITKPVSVQVSNWSNNDNFHGAYSFRSLETERRQTCAVELGCPVEVPCNPPTDKEPTNQKSDCELQSKELRTTEPEDDEECDMESCCSDLAEPDDNEDKPMIPVLLFAGEATSEHYYSTVHGAFESGCREAQRLIEYYTRLPPGL